MEKKYIELLKEMSPEDREEAQEKVIDLETEILVRNVKNALAEAGFTIL